MLLNAEINKIETSGNIVAQDMKMKASPIAFQILSSGLYSNKVQAVIRELSTNCADAHVAAGTQDRPFIVHLPNRIEPYFRVRDFGTGMSRDNVENRFSTYFDSTKTDSNDFTGCLGLGSKSPFSISDSFSVVSFFGGKKMAFSCYLSENGTPKVSFLGEIDSDEPNGVEITVPVSQDMIWQFKGEAEKVYRWFIHRPTITGVDLQITDFEVVLSGNGWKVLRDDNESCKVVMGNVAYPLPNEIRARHLAFPDNCFLVLEMPIGACSIAASREALGVDEPTRKMLKETLAKVSVELLEALQRQINSKENYWEARKFYQGFIRRLGTEKVEAIAAANLKFQDKPIVSDKTWNILRGFCPRYGRKKTDVETFQKPINGSLAKGDRVAVFSGEPTESNKKLLKQQLQGQGFEIVFLVSPAELAAFQDWEEVPEIKDIRNGKISRERRALKFKLFNPKTGLFERESDPSLSEHFLLQEGDWKDAARVAGVALRELGMEDTKFWIITPERRTMDGWTQKKRIAQVISGAITAAGFVQEGTDWSDYLLERISRSGMPSVSPCLKDLASKDLVKVKAKREVPHWATQAISCFGGSFTNASIESETFKMYPLLAGYGHMEYVTHKDAWIEYVKAIDLLKGNP